MRMKRAANMKIEGNMQRWVSICVVSGAIMVSSLRAADVIPAGIIDFTTGAKAPVDATGFSIH